MAATVLNDAQCLRAVEIEAREVESWAQRTAAAHGFTHAEHVVDIFGLCETCTAAADAADALAGAEPRD